MRFSSLGCYLSRSVENRSGIGVPPDRIGTNAVTKIERSRSFTVCGEQKSGTDTDFDVMNSIVDQAHLHVDITTHRLHWATGHLASRNLRVRNCAVSRRGCMLDSKCW